MNSDFSKKQKYSAVVIGAGRIGSSFDDLSSRCVLTHAHAISAHTRFELLGMSDIDSRVGKREAKKWRTCFYADNDRMLSEIRPDVVVIASPDETHAEMIMLALQYSPKLIICEKPVVAKQEELSQLKEVIKKFEIPVIVNFSRRFDATTVRLGEELQKRTYGRVISANGTYTNGVLHNGSHLLDLARFFFGEIKEVKGLGTVPDHGQGAPSVVGFATFEGCPQFSLLSGDERAYAVFEMEIMTEKKRIRLENFGQELVMQDVEPDPIFKGFKALSKRKVTKTKLNFALPELYLHALRVLEGEEPSRSSLAEGLETQAACFALLESVSRKN